MPRVRADHQRFWLPKAGHTEAEYEDASAGPSWDESGTVHLAVADGATESAFAGAWARALCQAWVRDPDGAIDRARTVFEAETSHQIEDLPWYAQAKLQEGAFATVLGLSVSPDGSWKAVAVGDTVLLVFYRDEPVEAWPYADAADFDNSPDLVGSRADRPGLGIGGHGGTWAPGMTFALVTDALAAYILGHDPTALLGLGDTDEFTAFISAARQDGMRNDDVTALILRLY